MWACGLVCANGRYMPVMYEAENEKAGCLGGGVLLPKSDLKDLVPTVLYPT